MRLYQKIEGCMTNQERLMDQVAESSGTALGLRETEEASLAIFGPSVSLSVKSMKSVKSGPKVRSSTSTDLGQATETMDTGMWALKRKASERKEAFRTAQGISGIAKHVNAIVLDKQNKNRAQVEESTPISRFVLSSRFDHITAMLLLSNAFFIGVQVEYMYQRVVPVWVRTLDVVYAACFILELASRIYAGGAQVFFWTGVDRQWNWFDFLIVTFSSIDTGVNIVVGGDNDVISKLEILRIIRIVRVTRVLRVIRVMKFFKDLRVMISAICCTLKTACWALVLLWIAVYIFGVAVAQFSAEYISDRRSKGEPLPDDSALIRYFGSLPKALFALLMSIANGIDWEVCYIPLHDVGPEAVFTYVFFILFATFCMMNVILGIFCHNAMEAFDKDKEKLLELHMAERYNCVESLTELFTTHMTSNSSELSVEEFATLIQDPEMQAVLKTLDIETRDARTLFEVLDHDRSGSLDLEELIEGCITLRGAATAVQIEKAASQTGAILKRVKEIELLLQKLVAATVPRGKRLPALRTTAMCAQPLPSPPVSPTAAEMRAQPLPSPPGTPKISIGSASCGILQSSKPSVLE
jgi:hypothetical protein